MAIAAAVVPGRAMVLGVTTADVERALAIARDTEPARTAFHAPYLVSPGDATVDQLEVITEFRRVVLAGEDRGRFGDWMFLHSAASAEKAVAPWHGLVTLIARLRFHPQNALTSVPPYLLDVEGADGRRLPAVNERLTPTWSLPFKTPQGEGTALLGATLEADFRATQVGNGARRVHVVLADKDLVAIPIDFRTLQ